MSCTVGAERIHQPAVTAASFQQHIRQTCTGAQAAVGGGCGGCGGLASGGMRQAVPCLQSAPFLYL